MRVLAIAQFLKPAAGHRHRLAEGIPRHPVGDGLVIGGGAGKGLAGKTAAGLDADIAVIRQFGKHRVIIGRVADNGHEIMVLGRGAKHGRPANIDIFDKPGEIVGLFPLRLERIEIDRKKVDAADLLRVHGGEMVIIVAARQKAAMDFRMKRLHPAIHDFGKACNLGNVRDLQPCFAKASRRATR